MNQFFENQNSLFKIFVILFGIFCSIVVSDKNFAFIFITTAILLFISSNVYTFWFKIILRLLPFFASYFLLGVIFKISFIYQVRFSFRILFFLLLTSYLIKSISTDNYLQDSVFMQKYKSFRSINFFLMFIVFFIPVFLEEYKIHKKANFVNTVADTFVAGLHRIKSIESDVTEQIQTERTSSRLFWTFPNLHLLLLFLIYSVSLAV